MPSQLKLLREARKSGNFSLIDNSMSKRIRNVNSRKGGSKSPDNDDMGRIIDDYAFEGDIKQVINREGAKRLIDQIELGNTKKGLQRDFSNFISGVTKKAFEDFAYKKYLGENLNRLFTEKFITNSGKEIGIIRVNKNNYLRVIEIKERNIKYVSARNIKTGRAVKFRKSWSKFFK